MTETRNNSDTRRTSLEKDTAEFGEELFGWVDQTAPEAVAPSVSGDDNSAVLPTAAVANTNPVLEIPLDNLTRVLGDALPEGTVPSLPGFAAAPVPLRSMSGVTASEFKLEVYHFTPAGGQHTHSVTPIVARTSGQPGGLAPSSGSGGAGAISPVAHLSTATGQGIAVAALVAMGKEDQPLPLHITAHGPASTADALTYHITGLPAGARLSAGQPAPGGSWVLTSAEVAGPLALVPGSNWFGQGQLQITASGPGHADLTTALPFIVIGVGDPAQIGGVSSGTVTEDSAISTGGHLTITDPDAGEASFAPVQFHVPTGFFTLDASGNWNFRLDNGASAVQALGATDQLTERFTVTARDGTAQEVVVTVHGQNDAPQLAASSISAQEDGPRVSGVLAGRDTDGGDVLTYAVTGSLPAGFSLTADGAWVFDPAQQAYQHLAAGQTLVMRVPVTATDPSGAQARQTLEITIVGSNDGPRLSGLRAVMGEDAPHATGQIGAQDPDTTDVLHFTADRSIAGFVMSDDGYWSYTPKPGTYQHLRAGETTVLDVPVTVRDAQGASDGGTLHLTITGSNDAPTITGDFTGATTEDAQTFITGALSITDVDTGESAFQARNAVATTYGLFSISASGSWSYRVDSTNSVVQGLTTGQQLTDEITVTAADGITQKITVTINGADDTAHISGADTGTVTEDKQLTAKGTLTVSDPDKGQAVFRVQTGQAVHYGTFDLDAAGHWSYVLDTSNPAVQALHAGDHVEDRILVASADGTTHEIVVSIGGADDVAHITGTAAGAVAEDTLTFASGKLNVQDPDRGQAVFVTQHSIATPHGVFTIDASGAWWFRLMNLHPDVQGLGVGGQLKEEIIVATADGATQKITVTINGTNDAAHISGVYIGAVVEDTTLQTSGTLAVQDRDAGEAVFVPISGMTAQHGTFSVDSSGRWTYTLDASDPVIQSLPQGAQITELVTVTSLDGTQKTISITINGTNDAARISGTAVADVNEDQTNAVAGQLNVADPDSGEAKFLPMLAAQASHGSFSITASGAWTYTLDNSDPVVQALRPSDTLTDSIVVSSADGTSQTITVNIHGAQDQAVIGGIATGAVTEDTAVDAAGDLTVSGTLQIQDADTSEAAFSAGTQTGAQGGTLSIDAAGHWTYSIPNSNTAVQALGQGETLTEQFTVASIDGTTQAISITVNGANDAPTLTAVSLLATEDGNTVSGQVTGRDADATAQLTYSMSVPVAGLTLDPDGHFTFDPTVTAYQSLRQGETRDLTIPVEVRDEHGAVAHSQLVVHMTGTNDLPIIGGLDHAIGSVSSATAGTVRVSGQLVILDADQGEARFHVQTMAGTYGTLGITADGQWTYSADGTQRALVQLQGSQHVTDVFTVRSADGTTHEISIQIQGSNTAAAFGGVTTGLVKEDAQQSASGQMTVMDPNAGESAFQPETLATAYGHFSIDAGGHWTYVLDNQNVAVQSLAESASISDRIVVGSVDGTPHVVTVRIVGANDAPVISGSASAALTEDGPSATATGKATLSDVDTGDSHIWTVSGGGQGSYGQFSIDAVTGQWTYQLDNSLTATQALRDGETQTESFVISVRDTGGATTSQQIDVVVTGTNDVPVIDTTASRVTGAVTEDAPGATASGLLVATDADVGDSATWSVDSGSQGTYGTLVLDATSGQWTYTLDNSRSATSALRTGDTQTDTFTVSVTDARGATATQQIVVTVHGTDDGAVITQAQSPSVTEDHVSGTGRILQATGRLTILDPDAGEDHFDTNTPPTGTQGSGYDTRLGGHVALAADGSFTYTIDNRLPAVQSLGAGQTATDTVTIRSADGTTHQLTISIQGTNDAPVLQSLSTSATEDGRTVSGQMVASDADAGDSLSYSVAQPVAGLTLSADGTWSFDPSDAAYQHLAAGQTQTLTIPVTVTDSAGATDTADLVITVTGTNDAASIAGVDQAQLTEDSHVQSSQQDRLLVANGALSITDTDANQNSFVGSTQHDAHGGTLMIGASGHWVYSIDNTASDVQSLGAGESFVSRFTVRATDGSTHEILVTVRGTNDAPVLAASSASSTEDGGMLSGQMVATDADSGDTRTFSTAQSVPGFTLAADGTWSFDPSVTAYQHLAAGVTQTLNILVTVTDGQGAQGSATLSITVTGTNDGAVISGDFAGAVTEDVGLNRGDLTATGMLQVSDTDDAEGSFQTNLLTGAHGGQLIVNANGRWNYVINNGLPSVQQLGDGDQLTETFTVRSKDGTPQQITITIHGHQDAPQIGGVHSGDVTEDGVQTISNSLTISDADQGEAVFVAGTQSGTYGQLSIDATGHWSYTLNNANAQVQALNTGDVAKDSFTVTTADGTHQLIEVTVHGDDDGARLTGTTTGTITEDTTASYAGAVKVAGATGGFGDHTITGQYGALDLRNDGRWFYTLDNSNPAVQALADGQHVTDTLTITAPDGSRHTITMTVQGAHDLPVISATGTVAPAIDSVEQIGTPTAATDMSAFGADATGVAVGTKLVSLFAPGSDVDLLAGLDPADRPTVFRPYTPMGVSGFVYFPQHGWFGNHVGKATGLETGWLDPSVRNAWAGGLAVFSDGTVARLDKVCDGHGGEPDYIYFANYQGLKAGQGATVVHGHATAGATVELYSGSGQGATLIATVTAAADGIWTGGIAGLSDGDHLLYARTNGVTSPPQVFHVVGQAVTETLAPLSGGAVSASGTSSSVSGDLTVTDVDTGDNPAFVAQTSVTGTYGTFSIDVHGHWTYHLDPNNPAARALATGQSLSETFQVEVTTASGEHATRDIAVEIMGTNDAPTVTGGVIDFGTVTPGSQRTFTGSDLLALVGATDSAGDTLSVARIGVDHAQGTIVDNGDGTFTLVPAVGVTGKIQLQVYVTDGVSTVRALGQVDAGAAAPTTTGTPTPGLTTTAVQQVIGLTGGTGAAIFTHENVHTGGAMSGLTLELSLITGGQVGPAGGHHATLAQYGGTSGGGGFAVTGPDDLTVHIGGSDYRTGVPMINDGTLHRYGFVWDGRHGTLDVMIDGQVVKHLTGVGQGETLPDGGTFTVGGDRAGGFPPDGGLNAQVFSAALAHTPVDPDLIHTEGLGVALNGDGRLVTDVQMQGGHLTDLTGAHSFDTHGTVTHPMAIVDAAAGDLSPDAGLSLSLTGGTHNGQLVGQYLSGFLAGTVIEDGHGHSKTIAGPHDLVDLDGWDMQTVSVTNPSGFHRNFLVVFTEVTREADGTLSSTSAYHPAVFDPTRDTPNADVGGRDTQYTMETNPITGRLQLDDPDGGSANVFSAASLRGDYGRFSMDVHGIWTYRPDMRARALDAGDHPVENFVVQSHDGTSHVVSIEVRGLPNAAPPYSSDAPTEDGPAEDVALEVPIAPAPPVDDPMQFYLASVGAIDSLDARTSPATENPYLAAVGVTDENPETTTQTPPPVDHSEDLTVGVAPSDDHDLVANEINQLNSDDLLDGPIISEDDPNELSN